MPEEKTKKDIAKDKYATKVCGYLGLDKKKCEALFDKLYENMKAVVEAL